MKKLLLVLIAYFFLGCKDNSSIEGVKWSFLKFKELKLTEHFDNIYRNSTLKFDNNGKLFYTREGLIDIGSYKIINKDLELYFITNINGIEIEVNDFFSYFIQEDQLFLGVSGGNSEQTIVFRKE